jgi:hypothetical protein
MSSNRSQPKRAGFVFSSTITLAFFFSFNWLMSYFPCQLPHEIALLPRVLLFDELTIHHQAFINKHPTSFLFPISAWLFALIAAGWVTVFIQLLTRPESWKVSKLLLITLVSAWIWLPSTVLITPEPFFWSLAGVLGISLIVVCTTFLMGLKLAGSAYPGIIIFGSLAVFLWFVGQFNPALVGCSLRPALPPVNDAAAATATAESEILTETEPAPNVLSSVEINTNPPPLALFALLTNVITWLSHPVFDAIGTFITLGGFVAHVMKLRATQN